MVEPLIISESAIHGGHVLVAAIAGGTAWLVWTRRDRVALNLGKAKVILFLIALIATSVTAISFAIWHYLQPPQLLVVDAKRIWCRSWPAQPPILWQHVENVSVTALSRSFGRTQPQHYINLELKHSARHLGWNHEIRQTGLLQCRLTGDYPELADNERLVRYWKHAGMR